MKHLPTAFAILGMVVTGACGGSTPTRPGGLEVSWTIGGSSACSSFSSTIATVRISLITGNGVYDTETIPCQSQQPYAFRNLEPGAYRVQIDGFPAGSEYASFMGSTPDPVSVAPNAVSKVPRIEMSEKPGAVDLTWKFYDGSLCAFAGVDSIEVHIWDSHGAKQFADSFPCDPVLAKDTAEKKDPAVELYPGTRGVVIDNLYAGSGYTLRAFGILESEFAKKYWAEHKFNVDFGRVTDVDVVLNPCKANDAICAP